MKQHFRLGRLRERRPLRLGKMAQKTNYDGLTVSLRLMAQALHHSVPFSLMGVAYFEPRMLLVVKD